MEFLSNLYFFQILTHYVTIVGRMYIGIFSPIRLYNMLWSYLSVCRHFYVVSFWTTFAFWKVCKLPRCQIYHIWRDHFILHIKGYSIIIHIENAEKRFPCVGVLLMGWEGTCMTLKYISIQVLDIFMYLFLTQNNFYFLFSGKPKELMKINCVTWDISTWFKLGR